MNTYIKQTYAGSLAYVHHPYRPNAMGRRTVFRTIQARRYINHFEIFER